MPRLTPGFFIGNKGGGYQHFSFCHGQSVDITGIIHNFKNVSNSEFLALLADLSFLLRL
jgi:hypothetical protein